MGQFFSTADIVLRTHIGAFLSDRDLARCRLLCRESDALIKATPQLIDRVRWKGVRFIVGTSRQQVAELVDFARKRTSAQPIGVLLNKHFRTTLGADMGYWGQHAQHRYFSSWLHNTVGWWENESPFTDGEGNACLLTDTYSTLDTGGFQEINICASIAALLGPHSGVKVDVIDIRALTANTRADDPNRWVLLDRWIHRDSIVVLRVPPFDKSKHVKRRKTGETHPWPQKLITTRGYDVPIQ